MQFVMMLLLIPTYWKSKADCEMGYWKKKHAQESANRRSPSMENAPYRTTFTQPFRLATSFFRDKKVLDVGCGPRGSLEFLTGVARATVCVDPLALNYSTLGAWSHSMVYVSGGIESLPLASNSFDVVSSINNFDHVEDAGRGLAEVYRVLRPGGVFMLAVEIHPKPTKCEPLSLGWDFERTIGAAGLQPHLTRFWLNPKGVSHSLANTMWNEESVGRGLIDQMVRDGSIADRTGWFVGIFNKSRL